MRLLVGIDHREGGRDALELARVLGAEKGAGAVVVTVLFTGPLPMQYALLPEEEDHEARGLLAEARERLPGLEVETRAYGGGSPAGILTNIAEAEDFDAIVVGSPHRGPIGRVMAGSVAMSLLNGASTDVAVAPKGYAEAHHDPLRRIAVGFDGTAEAKVALRRAEALAQRSNALVEVVTVVRPAVAAAVMAPGVYVPQAPLEPEKVINEGVNSVDPRLAAERVRLDGDPAAELSLRCEQVDMLVIGSRGYGPLARVLLGSVSSRVVNGAPCPVLVARRAP